MCPSSALPRGVEGTESFLTTEVRDATRPEITVPTPIASIGSERVSGADMCPALFENGLFPETLILTLREL
jgi:hypothetical protein